MPHLEGTKPFKSQVTTALKGPQPLTAIDLKAPSLIPNQLSDADHSAESQPQLMLAINPNRFFSLLLMLDRSALLQVDNRFQKSVIDLVLQLQTTQKRSNP